MLAPVLAVLLAVQGPEPPPGQRPPTPNPRVFPSGSGRCELRVHWRDEDGRGPARYDGAYAPKDSLARVRSAA